MNRRLPLRFFASLGLISLLLMGPQDAHADAADKFFRALKGVAWAALSVGVDEAGSRLLGPTIWRVVKRVAEPALKELAPGEDKPSRTEVVRVVHSIDTDAALRRNIVQRFEALPKGQREALTRKIDEIADHLFRIERLATETNIEVKEVKHLLLSVLRTPTFVNLSPSSMPADLRRFDVHDSLLSIFYPRGLTAPRKQGYAWIAGARLEQGWKVVLDQDEPAIIFRIIGAPGKPGTKADKKGGMAAVREQLTTLNCDLEDQRYPIQELSKQVGMLFVGMCDRLLLPNTYVAVRLFYSNGAFVHIKAIAIGDSTWEEFEQPLLKSMRLTKLRGPCGFYGTACCIPSGAAACEPGLACRSQQCLPRSTAQ